MFAILIQINDEFYNRVHTFLSHMVTLSLLNQMTVIEEKVQENKNGGPKKMSHIDMMMASWVQAEMLASDESDED